MYSDPSQLIELLSSLPAKIRDAETAYLKKAEELETAELTFDVAFGNALVASTAPNATEKKAEATIATEKESLELIGKKYEAKRAETEWKYLTDKFVALRKVASLEQEMLRTQLSGE